MADGQQASTATSGSVRLYSAKILHKCAKSFELLANTSILSGNGKMLMVSSYDVYHVSSSHFSVLKCCITIISTKNTAEADVIIKSYVGFW